MAAEYQVKLTDDVSAPAKKASSSLKRLKGAMGLLKGASSKAGAALGKVVAAATRMASSVAMAAARAAAAVAAIGAAFGAAAFHSAAFMEQQEMAFGLLLRSGPKGAAELAKIRKVAVELGLPVKDTITQYKKLLAMQFAPKAAMEIVKMGADMRALGASADEVGRIITAMSQIKAKGKLSMEELRQQLGDAGISVELVAKQLAKLRGITKEKAFELISEGAISADEGIKAIKMAVKAKLGIKNLGDAAKKTTGTLGGMWAVMKSKAENTLLTLSVRLLPHFKKGLQIIQKIMADLGFGDEKLIDRAESLVKSLISGAKKAYKEFGPLIKALNFDKAIGHAKEIASVFEDSIKPIMKGLKPMIEGFGEGFDQAMKDLKPVFKELREAFGGKEVGEGMRGVGRMMGTALAQGIGLTVALLAVTRALLSAIGELRDIWPTVSSASKSASISIQSDIDGILESIETFGGSLGGMLSTVVQVGFAAGKAIGESIVSGFKSFNISSVMTQSLLMGFPGLIVSAVQGAVSIGKAIGDGIVSGIKGMLSSVMEAASSLARAAINAAKSALSSDSPSKVFAQIGRDVGAGMTQGISASEPAVAATTRGMVSASTSAAATAAQTTNNNRISSSPTINVNGSQSPRETAEAIMNIQLQEARALLEQLGASMGALTG